MLCTVAILIAESSQLVELSALQDNAGNTVTGALVECWVYESDGTTEVGGVVFPLILTHTGAPDGTYQGQIPYQTQLVAGADYVVKIRATDGAARRTWALNALAKAA